MKKGITISILVVTVVMMFSIVTTATVIGVRAIHTASYEEFLSKLLRVSNDVNKYVIDNDTLPTTSEIIAKEGLSNSFKEELNKNNDASNNLFVIDMTKLRTESVNIGKGTIEDMDVFVVAENTYNVYYLKGIEYRGTAYYGIPTEGISVIEDAIPKDWAENVVALVDGVPIPKGFVASPYVGENIKNGGLVIYELKANETSIPSNETHQTSLTTRNQYVWVPVENFNLFKRQDFGMAYTISNELGSNHWEVVLDEIINIPLTIQSTTYMSATTLAEVQAMYASVREYKGFYIARYEAGLENKRTSNTTIIKGDQVYSVMNKIPYNYVQWANSITDNAGGAVEIARSIYTSDGTNENYDNYGVVSTLTYGVQWDSILQWWLNTKAITTVTNSTNYGNYKDSEVAQEDFNEGATYAVYSEPGNIGTYIEPSATTSKGTTTMWAVSTGALKYAAINNIYDMAGNMWEWTMEGYTPDGICFRGGSCYNNGNSDGSHVSKRSSNVYAANFSNPNIGFRVALYIKK